MIAIDVSKSMLAKDISPNRLERAKREVRDFLEILEGDRLGLIAFAGTSFVQAPLTIDYRAIELFLDELDAGFIPLPGTALGHAIENGVKSLESKTQNSQAIILITDGEDHDNQVDQAIQIARDKGIRIYTVGVGKREGAPIPGTTGGFVKDASGAVVLTKLNEETLKMIATRTDGKYVRSVSGDFDLDRIYQDLRGKLDENDLGGGRRKRFTERFQWPLLIAFFFLLLDAMIWEQKNQLKTMFQIFKIQKRMHVLIFFLLVFAAGFPQKVWPNIEFFRRERRRKVQGPRL